MTKQQTYDPQLQASDIGPKGTKVGQQASKKVVAAKKTGKAGKGRGKGKCKCKHLATTCGLSCSWLWSEVYFYYVYS